MGSRAFAAMCCFLGAFLVPGLPPAGAAGTIDTTDTEFEIGAGSPTGATTVDSAAPVTVIPTLPPLPAIGTMGTITGSLPAFPGAGTGTDGDFNASADMMLAGGTYNFSSYTVTNDAVIEYSGAVVIHVTGNVSLDGTVTTAATDADVEFRCGGDFELISESTTPNGIDVDGANASVTIHVGGDLSLGTGGTNQGALLESVGGAVRVTAHGLTVDGGDIVTDRLRVNARTGGFECRAAQSILLGFGNLFGSGGVVVQSFGAGVTCEGFPASRDTPILFEAALGLTLTEGASLSSGDGTTTLRALGGDLVLADCDVDMDGELIAHASSSVLLSDRGRFDGGDGGVDVRAFGGDIVVGAPGGVGSFVDGSAGGATLTATADIIVENGSLSSGDGAFLVRALGGEFRVGADSDVDMSSALFDVRANTSISIDSGECLDAAALQISAGTGGIDIGEGELNAQEGNADILSSGPVRLRGTMFVDGDVTIGSTGGDVDFSGENSGVRTANGNADPSGSIILETWNGGCIVASEANFRTGTSNVQSGDISFLTHGGDAGPPDDVKSFFLPKNVVVKVNDAKPEKSRLTAVGFFDVGPGNPDLSGEATLDVGGLSVTANLEVSPNGSSVRLRSDGFDFLVKPNRTGSSRAKFKLKVQRDLGGMVPTEGELALRFRRGDLDGAGRIVLEGGKFKLGKKRGLLSEPVIFPFKAKASLKGGGKDTLAVLAGIATDSDAPAAASDVTVTFGTLTLVVAAGDFAVKSPGVFVAKNPPSAPGVKAVTIDYLREKVTLKAKDLDLGVFPEGAVDVTLGVQLADTARTVEVTAVRKGKRLKY